MPNTYYNFFKEDILPRQSRSLSAKSYGKIIKSAAVFAFSLLFIIGCFIAPAFSAPEPEIDDVLQDIASKTASVGSYQAKVHLLIQDPQFLKDFFWNPMAGENYTARPSVYGMVKGTGGGSIANLYIQYEGNDYQSFIINGNAVNYNGLRRFKDLFKNDKKYKTIKYSSLLPPKAEFPIPAPTENDQQQSMLPEGVPDYSKTPENYVDLDPRGSAQINFHPLNFIVPFILQPLSNSNIYKIVSSKDKFLGIPCLVIQMTDKNTKDTSRVWLDHKRMRILQVEHHDIRANRKINAMYLGYSQKDADTDFAFYNRVQVSCNGNPVYMAEISDPVINILEKKAKVEEEKREKEEARHRSVMELITHPTDEEIQMLTTAAKRGCTVLGLILLVFAMRFIFFRVSRQEFDDQLIVVDEEDGRFAEMLNKMGYRTIPFTPDIVNQEREYLGKGVTKETTYRPRAVVVTPDSFQFIQKHLYIIKAYVEEGGRVLVMYHPQSSNKDLPYKVEQIPLNNKQGFFFDYKADTITNVKGDNVKRLAQAYAGPEVVLSVNGKKFSERLLWCYKQDAKIEATVAGMVREGKGEYIVCQMQFSPSVTIKNTNMQFMLNDMFRYLLGLEAINTGNK
ncbi:hypothetical protein IJT93_02770 [bacterium]|nr:hypothetical protein [bacterium]